MTSGKYVINSHINALDEFSEIMLA